MKPRPNGMKLSETSSEASSANVMASAKGMKNNPARPPTKSIGTKTATVVSVPVTSGPAISFTPRQMPGQCSSPCSQR